MTLSAGTRLGPYEIQSALGAGGMGEVYRARDTRLDRTVAVKILPEALAADPQFRERFDREARAISQLDHPHICALYDVGQAAGTAYLVMQYLEGETLAVRLEREGGPKGPPLRLEEALTIAIQIAGALDAAHRAGVVHRDLKPGNVMLTKSGAVRQGSPQAKLLDFGLAKASAPAVAAGGQSVAPTVGGPVTAQGTILGTFQYMAPEQLEGKDADGRTDIFAFGAVLYEMLTGRKAFEGKSHASLVAAILEREPTPIATLQPLAPPALDRLLRKCLAKDPDARWQTARDLHDELQWVGQTDTPHPTAPAAVAGAAPASRRLYLPVAAAVATALALGAAAMMVYSASSAPVSLPTYVELSTPSTTEPLSFALSPDGRQLAFVASDERGTGLWVRRLDQAIATFLPGTEGASYPFWSPDSRQVAFFADNKLKRIDLPSGALAILANANGWFCNGAWNADGVLLYSPVPGRPILRVAAQGGAAARVTTVGPGQTGGHCEPYFLPDGQHFLFTVWAGEGRGIYLARLDGTTIGRLIENAGSPVYVPPGYLMYVSQGALLAQPFDVDRLTLSGSPMQVADLVTAGSAFGSAVSASRDGTIVYRREAGKTHAQFVWFSRSGERLGLVGEPDVVLAMPSLSPDRRHVVMMRFGGVNVDLWMLELARGVISRFTSDAAGNDVFPVWSPDGRRIVFSSTRVTGAHDLYVKAFEGGVEQPLLATTEDKFSTDWSPDGRHILYFTYDPKTQHDVWALPVDGGQKPVPVVQTEFEERNAKFSPDGNWIAYQSNESGRFEVYVQPFPGPGQKVRVSTNGGGQAQWRADARELFYIGLDRRMMAVPVRPSADGQRLDPGAPVPLFVTNISRPVEHLDGQSYIVSPDGHRFLVSTAAEQATAPITVLLHWRPN